MGQSRFTQYGGVAGADDALKQMVMARIQAEMEQRKRAVEDYKLGQTDRGMDLEGGRLTEDQRQFDAGADQRQAQTGYLRTQSADLQGKPLREADARAQAGMMQEQGHQNELAQIQAQGNQQARVAGIRTAGASQPKSTADELHEFEEKEKIKAKYGGSRPSLGTERQALAYFNRAQQASTDIGDMEDGIAQMGLAGQARLQAAPNFLQSESNQRYRQAQRAFTEARLRKESGAAIPVGEYENDARTYFAQPGDGPEVIAQKRQARETVLQGLKFASGKAYDEFYGQGQGQAAPKPGVTIKAIRQVR